MSSRPVRLGAGLLTAALAGTLTASCAGTTDDDAAGASVAAAFYPLAFVAEQVADGHAEVTNLTSPGGEPHDLELTLTETLAVTEAELVVLLRGFQPAVEEVVDASAEGRVLDAADVVELLPDPADGGADDPHFWLDPLLMADLGDAVAEELADLDPDHGEKFRTNAKKLRTDLTALDAAYSSGLAGCERDTVVVSHNAFQYLERYGLTVEAINGLSPDAEPTPADIARLQRLVADEGITTVFSETLATPELAETLASDMGITTAVLDPVEGLADTTADEDYLSLAEANLLALQKANGC